MTNVDAVKHVVLPQGDTNELYQRSPGSFLDTWYLVVQCL